MLTVVFFPFFSFLFFVFFVKDNFCQWLHLEICRGENIKLILFLSINFLNVKTYVLQFAKHLLNPYSMVRLYFIFLYLALWKLEDTCIYLEMTCLFFLASILILILLKLKFWYQGSSVSFFIHLITIPIFSVSVFLTSVNFLC